jgi:Na+/H+ antiporter NhaD/arsenite permease-like protein
MVGMSVGIAVTVFVIAYVLIATERAPTLVVALAGAADMMALNEREAIQDTNSCTARPAHRR